MIPRNLIWAVVVITTALLQVNWLEDLRIMGVLPDLLVILTVYFALHEGEERAMFTGLLGGLFQDVASGYVLGHHVLCLVVVGYAVGRVSTRLITDHPAVKAGLVFVSCLTAGLISTAILFVQQPDSAAVQTVIARVLPQTFYTALLTPVVFFVVDQVFRLAPEPQGRPA